MFQATIDIGSSLHHHRQCIVLVKKAGHWKERGLYYDTFVKLLNQKLLDIRSDANEVYPRLLTEYSPDNEHWALFQAHRTVHIVLSVALSAEDCDVSESAQSMQHRQEQLREKNTLLIGVVWFPGDHLDEVLVVHPDQITCDNLAEYVLLQLNNIVDGHLTSMENVDLEADLPMAPFEVTELVGLESRNSKRRKKNRLIKRLADWKLLSGGLVEALLWYKKTATSFKAINDWLWYAASIEGYCVASYLLQFDKTLTLTEEVSKELLNNEDILNKYKECLVEYGKFGAANVVAVECSLKIFRFLLQSESSKEIVAQFVDNVLVKKLSSVDSSLFTDTSPIYVQLSKLYNEMGCRRRASFLLWQGVEQCQNELYSLQWSLLNLSLEGFGIRRTNNIITMTGFKQLQCKLCQQLIQLSEKLNYSNDIVMWSFAALNCLYDDLNECDAEYFASKLSRLKLSEENLVNFLKIDSAFAVSMKEPPKDNGSDSVIGSEASPSPQVFIYTPLWKTADVIKPILWLQKEKNSLTFVVLSRLSSISMSLKVIGVDAMKDDQLLFIPVDDEYIQLLDFNISQKVEICIYSTHLGKLNIVSLQLLLFDCVEVCYKLSNPIAIRLIKKLPLLTSEFPDSIECVAGKSISNELTLRNVSDIPLVSLKLAVYPKSLFDWSLDNLNSQLPIGPGKFLAVTLYSSKDSMNEATCNSIVKGSIRIDYFGEQKRFSRSLNLQYFLKVLPSVEQSLQDYLFDQLKWNLAPDTLDYKIGELYPVKVSAEYCGDRIIPGPVRLLWGEHSGVLLSGLVTTQSHELSPDCNRLSLHSQLYFFNTGCTHLNLTLFFPITNLKATCTLPLRQR